VLTESQYNWLILTAKAESGTHMIENHIVIILNKNLFTKMLQFASDLTEVKLISTLV